MKALKQVCGPFQLSVGEKGVFEIGSWLVAACAAFEKVLDARRFLFFGSVFIIVTPETKIGAMLNIC
jgi:hypothetical protein